MYKIKRDIYEENQSIKVSLETIIEKNDFVLFFKYKNIIFAATEESRLIFAKIKTHDDEIPPTATFMGFDIQACLKGEEKGQVFSSKDLKSIKVIDKNEVFEKISGEKPNGDVVTTLKEK